MTEKTKPQRSAKGKDESKGGLYDERGNDHNPLTRTHAYKLLRGLHGELVTEGDFEPCINLLLLLYALAHEEDRRERWAIYYDAREMFAVHAAPKVDDAIDDALEDALHKLKGGA